MVYLQTTYELCFGEAYFESCDFSCENTNIDVSVFMFDLRWKTCHLNVNMIDTEKYQPARQNMKFGIR